MAKVRFSYSIDDFLFSRLDDIASEYSLNKNEILDSLVYYASTIDSDIVELIKDYQKYKAYREYVILDGRVPEPYI